MKKDTNRKPFFARLLEEQELDQVSGAGPAKTQKWPSDGDDSNLSVSKPKDGTLKYPSDGEESGV